MLLVGGGVVIFFSLASHFIVIYGSVSDARHQYWTAGAKEAIAHGGWQGIIFLRNYPLRMNVGSHRDLWALHHDGVHRATIPDGTYAYHLTYCVC